MDDSIDQLHASVCIKYAYLAKYWDSAQFLLCFCHDCGLLSANVISILDFPDIYSEPTNLTEYFLLNTHEFRIFLLKIACIVYSNSRHILHKWQQSQVHDINTPEYDESDIALQYLLTQYIHPFLQGSVLCYNIYADVKYNIEIVNTLSEFSQFFQSWYALLVLSYDISQQYKHSFIISNTLWNNILEYKINLSIKYLLNEYQSIISSTILPLMYIEQYIMLKNTNIINLNFNDFMLTNIWIVQQLQLSREVLQINCNYFTTITEYTYFFIDLIADKYFIKYKQNMNNLNIDKLLWYFRSSGLFSKSSLSFDKILDIFLSLAKTKNINELDYDQFPLLLTQLIPLISTCVIHQYNSSFQLSLYLKYTFICKYYPSIIFILYTNIPSLLNILYTINGYSCIKEIHIEIEKILQYFHIAENQLQKVNSIFSSYFINNQIVYTYRACLKVSQDIGILNRFISYKTFRHAFEYLIESNKIDFYYLNTSDIIEVLYVLSQIVFHSNTIICKQFTVHNDSKDSVDVSTLEIPSFCCSNDPIECFKSLILFFDESINSMHIIDSKDDASIVSSITYQHTDIGGDTDHNSEYSKPSHNELTTYHGPSAVNLFLVFSLFPCNSPSFTPFTVATLFLQVLKVPLFDASNALNAKATLSQLIHVFSMTFSIANEEISKYLLQMYVQTKVSSFIPPILKPEVCQSLWEFEYFALNEILILLQKNRDLLLFEFMRVSARCGKKTRKMLTTLAKFDECPTDVYVTSDIAVHWAYEMYGVSEIIARNILTNIFNVSSKCDSMNNHLTFSLFIVFAVHVSIRSNTKAMTESIRSRYYVECINSLLKQLSNRLNTLSCVFLVNILHVFTDKNISSTIDTASTHVIFECALDTASRSIFHHPHAYPSLPPRPPPTLWDAPRFIDFLIHCRLLSSISCMQHAWNVFGNYLLDSGVIQPLSKWDSDGVVPPIPIVISTNIVMALLHQLIPSNNTLVHMTICTCLPVLVAIADEIIDSSPSTTNTNTNVMYFGDILRFGGDNIVYFLHTESVFLHQLYQQLYSYSDSIITETLIKQLSCSEQLPLAGLYNSIISVLQCPYTDVNCSTNEEFYSKMDVYINLTFIQFEEICIRYAYNLWIFFRHQVLSHNTSSHTNANDYNVNIIVTLYIEQCLAISLDPMYSRSSSWGVNFISPFISILRCEFDDTFIADESTIIHTNVLVGDEINSFIRDHNEDNLKLDEPLVDVVEVEKKDELSEELIAKRMLACKETLWPLYATYCSCGDSSTPGRLSGPNLFALLSKLDLLSPTIPLSDICILIHLVSTHSFSHREINIARYNFTATKLDYPSLSFEEFLVFLCAIAELTFEHIDCLAATSSTTMNEPLVMTNVDVDFSHWYSVWQSVIANSTRFQRLLDENISILFSNQPLHHHLEDVRFRDRYVLLFSIDVLLQLQKLEEGKLKIVHDELNSSLLYETTFSQLCKDSKIAPNLVSFDTINRLLQDLLLPSEQILIAQTAYLIGAIAIECVKDTLTKVDVVCSNERKKVLVCEHLVSVTAEMDFVIQSQKNEPESY